MCGDCIDGLWYMVKSVSGTQFNYVFALFPLKCVVFRLGVKRQLTYLLSCETQPHRINEKLKMFTPLSVLMKNHSGDDCIAAACI